jgi:hypothetical protein
MVLLPDDEEVQVRISEAGTELVFVDTIGVERVVRVPMRQVEKARAAA